jgi:hypothetical protein
MLGKLVVWDKGWRFDREGCWKLFVYSELLIGFTMIIMLDDDEEDVAMKSAVAYRKFHTCPC